MGKEASYVLWLALLLGTSGLSPSFLSTKQTPGAYTTSQGQLASGLEALQPTLNSLRSQSSGNSAFIRSTAATTREDSLSLLNSELASAQDQVRNDQSQVDYFSAILAADSRSCLSFVTCDRCTANRECVWCPSLQFCTAGDSQGPINGECMDFQHMTCGLECGGFEGCFACARHENCAWCQNTRTCVDQSQQTGACGQITDCYTQDLAASGSYQGDTSDLDEVRRELNITQQALAQFQGISSDIQAALASSTATSSTPSPPSLLPDLSLTGLASVVDSQAQREDANDLSELRETANAVGQLVSGAAVSEVFEGNSQIEGQESDFGESIRRTQANINQESAEQRAAAATARAAAAALASDQTSENEPLEASSELNTTESFSNETSEAGDNVEEGPVGLNSTDVPPLGVNDTQEIVENQASVELNATEQTDNETSLTDGGLDQGAEELNSTDISTEAVNNTQDIDNSQNPSESLEPNTTEIADNDIPQTEEMGDQEAFPGQNSTDISTESPDIPVIAEESQSLPADETASSSETPAESSSSPAPDDSNLQEQSTPAATSFTQLPLTSFLPSP